MSGFNKRVALLEKWAPNLLPKVKDLDDLADIIYDTWLEAEADTEQRIIKLIEADRHESHAIDDIFDGVVGMTLSRSEFKQALIKLINGETK